MKSTIVNTVRLIFLLFVLLLSGCEKYDDIVPFTEYTIKEGDHYSSHFSETILSSEFLMYDIIFNESAKYTINAVDQYDINKLFGFSDCGDKHHENSARFGWRWMNDSLQIFAYYYNDNQIKYNHLCNVELNKSYRYTISLEENAYVYNIEGLVKDFRTTRSNNCDLGLYYLLYPYFGGNITAPHEITIYMKRYY